MSACLQRCLYVCSHREARKRTQKPCLSVSLSPCFSLCLSHLIRRCRVLRGTDCAVPALLPSAARAKKRRERENRDTDHGHGLLMSDVLASRQHLTNNTRTHARTSARGNTHRCAEIHRLTTSAVSVGAAHPASCALRLPRYNKDVPRAFVARGRAVEWAPF